jgi:histidine kinase
VRSLLCAPIKHQGKLSGVFYLENNLVPRAFTAERCRVLELLSGPAAISLENARLYATLDQRVKQRTEELQESHDDLARTLQRLRETQKQLVVQDKLASLGALTSGIAHEIKNPLNFVNNFAELSVGLADELRDTLAGRRAALGDDAAAVDEILGELRLNVAKIDEHGKRADGIVQAMLEHARVGGTDERRPTQLNGLVEKFATLAYHGMRTRDAGLEVAVETDLDPSLVNASVSSPEIGRVLLNLVNNACYAANARKKTADPGFRPTVHITTRNVGDGVEIRVRDNGLGIPAANRERIYDPFFTTKPPGEGTGLGLSISHEIVVPGHGGTLTFESVEGDFTEFVVTLPASGGPGGLLRADEQQRHLRQALDGGALERGAAHEAARLLGVEGTVTGDGAEHEAEG